MTHRSQHQSPAPTTADDDTRVADGAPDSDDAWEWEDDAPPEALPGRPRRRLVTPATAVLAGVVLAGAGFIGGVQVQRSSDDGPGGGGLGARAAMAGAGGPDAAGPASGGTRGAATATPGAGTTVGTVANVQGSRVYVTGADGTTVEVRVGDQATVSRLAKSSAGGVHPGDTVVVQGTSAADGTVSASSVRASAKGLSSGGLGALAGAGAGGPASGSRGAGTSGGRASAGSAGGSGASAPDAVDQLFQGD